MGIASLVLGIVSIIVGFIPFIGMLALIPAFVGLVLGIVEIVQKSKKSEPKGMGIAGTILSGLAVLIIFIWTFFIFTSWLELYDDDILLKSKNSSRESANEIYPDIFGNYLTY